MSKLNEHDFELLGELVTVQTNDLGTWRYITFGTQIIEDSSGECVNCPRMDHLHGAAMEAASKKHLKKVAESSIASFIFEGEIK